ncbi:hypothetical protein BDY24DRAFT_388815 [Mrakia frigida]|uniref:uncharacterized protein n=1 Tax=Mrakia frigida TaxID=29902 RepID=UPI003FCC0534
MSSFFPSLPPPPAPLLTASNSSTTSALGHHDHQQPQNGQSLQAQHQSSDEGEGGGRRSEEDRIMFEGLRKGMDSLFEKMEGDGLAQSDAIDRLQREVRLWKESYLSVDKERTLLRTQLTALQESTAAAPQRHQQEQLVPFHQPGSPSPPTTHLSVEGESTTSAGDHSSGGSPFTTIVIDGEALMLSETLLKQGKRGGLKAAEILFTGLREMAMAMAGQESDIICLGFLVISRFELGEQLVASGVIPFGKVFDDFCLGVADHASNLFTVVDVPPGKAEFKVKEYVNFFAGQDLCKMVILGGPNDGTYEPVLASAGDKVFVVNVRTETEGLDHALWPFEDQIIVIPDAFSTEMTGKRLRERRKARAAQPSTSAVVIPLPTPAQSPSTRLAALPSAVPVPTRNASAPPSLLSKNLQVVDSEMWTIMRTGEKVKKVKKEDPPPADKKRERGGSGRGGRGGGGKGGGTEMDQAYLVVKSLDPRPCHMTYLSPDGCGQPDTCIFGHGYELSRTEISAVSKLAKEMCCPNYKWGKCKKDNNDCIYSHECPRGDSCTFGESCWFPEHNGTPLPMVKADYHSNNSNGRNRRKK